MIAVNKITKTQSNEWSLVEKSRGELNFFQPFTDQGYKSWLGLNLCEFYDMVYDSASYIPTPSWDPREKEKKEIYESELENEKNYLDLSGAHAVSQIKICYDRFPFHFHQ